MIYDLFAGPGGWDEGLRRIGRTDVLGIEWDRAACGTALAAGHARLWADVAALDPAAVAMAYGVCEGLIASPPCQAWSMAGKRKGEQDRANCHGLADRMAEGDDSTDWTTWEDERSPLVAQPVRWVRELRPEWVALEEVPAVASLWEHFARIFRTWGYAVWTGDLSSEQYGVPQTRDRRILVAHRTRTVSPPAPTHEAWGNPSADDLFGHRLPQPISMGCALGWTDDGRRLRNNTQANAATRSLGEPAPTIFYGARLNDVSWVLTRPATAVCGDPRIFPPGYRGRAEDYASDGTYLAKRSGDGAIRVSVTEAATLQSFPADYPWQGSRTKQYQQIGNAIPPLLAAHILAALGVGTLPAEAVA